MYSSRQADTYAGESRAVHYKGTPKHYGVQPAADTKAIMSWQVRRIWTCFSINRQIIAVYLTKWRFETVLQEGAGVYMGV